MCIPFPCQCKCISLVYLLLCEGTVEHDSFNSNTIYLDWKGESRFSTSIKINCRFMQNNTFYCYIIFMDKFTERFDFMEIISIWEIMKEIINSMNTHLSQLFSYLIPHTFNLLNRITKHKYSSLH